MGWWLNKTALLTLAAIPSFAPALFTSDIFDGIAENEDPTPRLGEYLDSSVGLSSDTKITPSTAPVNTVSINVSTNTNFKGTLAVSPATGVVTVTDAHPNGTYAVTVRAFGSIGNTTTKTFDLKVTSDTCRVNPRFVSAPDLSLNDYGALSVAIGDFNGDGKQDLAVANWNGGEGRTASILLGGNFSSQTSVTVGSGPSSVAVGDFNGDGKQDLAVTNEGSTYSHGTTVSICLGDGMGGFNSSTSITVGDAPDSVAVGDFNGDGKQDLAVANFGSGSVGTVSILLGNGLGGFTSATRVNVGLGPCSVAVGDFNGDGKQDLAVANIQANTISIRLGDGLGGFSGSTEVHVSENAPCSVAIGDFNGDGKQDLAVASWGSGSVGATTAVSIRLGDGLGGFSSVTNVPVGDTAASIAIGDFNGDGKQDLAVANWNSNTISIRFGNGFGGFNGSTEVSVGPDPKSVAIGDFNGDGTQDLVVTHGTIGSYLSIRLGKCSAGGAASGVYAYTKTPRKKGASIPTGKQ